MHLLTRTDPDSNTIGNTGGADCKLGRDRHGNAAPHQHADGGARLRMG